MTKQTKSAKKPRLRLLDLSLEGWESQKRAEVEASKVSSFGGCRGNRKHPLGIYSFDKGREYQRHLREDLDRLLDNDILEIHGSPTWTLEVHKQQTHSGESPLLVNKYMASSKYESTNGLDRWSKEVLNPRRCSAPPAHKGVLFYRPNRTHQYLSATELRDAAESEVCLKYGRPTRTTLLRARQRAASASTNAYEIRRQIEQRMEEIKNGCIFSNPKEFLPEQTQIDGLPFHSFVTGARYNRAHCLDAKSLIHLGVYMPRNNPQGCFVIGQRAQELEDLTLGSPDSPRSDVDKSSTKPAAPRRPTTAPGYGRRSAPTAPSAPRPAWGDASSSVHINGDEGAKENDISEEKPVVEEQLLVSSGLNIQSIKYSLGVNRESQTKMESRLPSVRGTSLSRLRKIKDDVEQNFIDSVQPPPSPMAPASKCDSTSLPTVKTGEADPDRKGEHLKVQLELKVRTARQKPTLVDASVNVPSLDGSVIAQEGADKLASEDGEPEVTSKSPENAFGAQAELSNDEVASRRKKSEDVISDGVSLEVKVTSSVPASEFSVESKPMPPTQENVTPAAESEKAVDPSTASSPRIAENKEKETETAEDVRFFLTQEGTEEEVARVDPAASAFVDGTRSPSIISSRHVHTPANSLPHEDDRSSDTGSSGANVSTRSKAKKSVTFGPVDVKVTGGEFEGKPDEVTDDLTPGESEVWNNGDESPLNDTLTADNDFNPLKVIVTKTDTL